MAHFFFFLGGPKFPIVFIKKNLYIFILIEHVVPFALIQQHWLLMLFEIFISIKSEAKKRACVCRGGSQWLMESKPHPQAFLYFRLWVHAYWKVISLAIGFEPVTLC